MPSTDLPAEAAHDPEVEHLVEAGAYQTAKDGFDHGLVVLAQGLPFWLLPREGGFRLMVEPSVADEVRRQLACFDRESAGWPPPPFVDRTVRRNVELFTPLLWVLVVLACFWMQGSHGGWTAAGALDARALFDRGEVWRPFTALFLHADAGHLVSNALSGVFVFSAVLTTIGLHRGWALIALAAVAGNVAVAALHQAEDYRSIGASTAIFAALGLLTGRAIRVVMRVRHPHRWRTVFVPFAAGVAVLGLYGAGGQQVDVLAHVTGFAAGLLLGFVGVEEPKRPEG